MLNVSTYIDSHMLPPLLLVSSLFFAHQSASYLASRSFPIFLSLCFFPFDNLHSNEVYVIRLYSGLMDNFDNFIDQNVFAPIFLEKDDQKVQPAPIEGP